MVTTGSLADPVPDTQVLFGDRAYNDEARHQYRFQFGYWLGDCRRWAIQSDWLDLGHNSTEFSASSPGDPILARPFFDVLRGVPAVEIVAYPNWAAGSVHARVTDSFHSAGVTLRRNLLCKTACGTCDGTGCAGDGCLVGLSGGRLDLMGGYRHYQLRDTVTITEQITLTQGGGGQQAGTQFNVHDSFRSRNEFHGGEIGLIAQRFRGRWSFEGMAKLAMGNNRQSVTIDGQTVIRVPDQAPVSHIGGLLALEGTNIGTYQRNSFALIPHFNLELGYQLTKRSRVYVGYDFLLWTSVKRAGDHIDTRVNTAYMPPQVGPLAPPALPAFAWRSADFWAQGVNLGCEVRF